MQLKLACADFTFPPAAHEQSLAAARARPQPGWTNSLGCHGEVESSSTVWPQLIKAVLVMSRVLVS